MEQYTVTGMSCAACSSRVEKAVLKVPGVTSCSVSLLTNSMGVEGTATSAQIIEAVENAGYGASLKGAANEKTGSAAGNNDDFLKDRDTPVLKRRLIASLCFLIPLMYLSMGHMMWNWPLPGFMADNHVAMGLAQLLLTTIVMVINQKFFISGFKGLIHKAPNMDTLVALGSTASYGYSVYALFAMTDAQMRMDMDAVMSYMHEFYFESAAMILTLITVGKMLEARSKGKTTDALKSLMKLAPKTAVLLRDGKEETVSIEQVKKGDIFIVRPGENIPVDGIVLEGNSAVNEAALTGESIPVDKAPNDTVSAATVNQSGFLKCEASRVGEDTTLSQIIQMVSDAAATKAPIAKIADRVSGVFVPTVITIAVITIVVWLLAGQSVGFALARGISVLVISCPCALGLATPVAIMVGNGMGAKNGIMFKTAVSLEEAGKVQIVALDKTGTITCGEPKVTDILPAENVTEQELLERAAAEKVKAYGMSENMVEATMRKATVLLVGLSGRSIVPMLIGFGCTVPGVMASRTLPSERDRKMTILLTPFMSCSAKLPIYSLFAAAFFPQYAGLVMVLLYFTGIVVGVLAALLLKSTVFKGEAVPFVMELPNYRLPGLKNVAQLLWEKARDFLQKAFTVIFAATIVIWFLQNFDLQLRLTADPQASILARIAGDIAPLFGPLGFADWRISTALITGFMAKESVVSTLTILFGSSAAFAAALTPAQAAPLLVFCLLYTPCIAAVASVKRELGGKWAAIMVLNQCVTAWLCALVMRLILLAI